MSIQSNDPVTLPTRLSHRNAALVEMDILNCLQIVRELGSAEKYALFIDAFYTLCSEKTVQCGGEVVKYMGDSCLSIFDEDACVSAIDSVLQTREDFPRLCQQFDVKETGIRATIHTGEIVYGEFGPEGQKDVIGKMANELFQTIGRGITITEQVYRKLPNDRRGPWKKTGGQIIYTMK